MSPWRLALFLLLSSATATEALDKRNLRNFLYLRLADLRTGLESTERQQNAQPVIERVRPVRNDVMRPCYFSPVQCLLRTEGQHRVFENHPSINHFRTTALRRSEAERSARVRQIAAALDQEKQNEQEQESGTRREQRGLKQEHPPPEHQQHPAKTNRHRQKLLAAPWRSSLVF